MDCSFLSTSTCFCVRCCELHTLCTGDPSPGRCSFNPHANDTKELCNLYYALQNQFVIKCRTEKWQMQGLCMKIKDPLSHGDESTLLELMNEQLEEKIRDLEETLMEHEKSGKDIEMIRDKIRALWEQSCSDKKQLRQILANLKLQLAEADEETVCAGMHFLRAKLRQLFTRGEQRLCFSKDKHAKKTVEKLIASSTVLSRSCEDLKTENERIRVENDALRRALNSKEKDVPVSTPISKDALQVVQMVKDDKNITIDKNDEKQNEMEKLVMEQIKLAQSEDLINYLNRQLKERENVVIERDNLLEEFQRIKMQVENKNNEIIRICDERDKALNDSVALQSKLNAVMLSEKMKNSPDQDQYNIDQVATQEEQSDLVDSAEKLARVSIERDDLTSQLDILQHNFTKQQRDLENADDELQNLRDERETLKQKLQHCENNYHIIEESLRMLRVENELIKSQHEKSISETEDKKVMNYQHPTLRNELNFTMEDNSLFKLEQDRLNNEANDLRNENNRLQEDLNIAVNSRMTLEDSFNRVTAEREYLQSQINLLNESINELHQEHAARDNQIKALLEKLKSAKEECENSLETCQHKLSELNTSNSRLQSELSEQHKQILGLTDALETSESQKVEALEELMTLKGELEQLIGNMKEMVQNKEDSETEKNTLKEELIDLQQKFASNVADFVDLKKFVDKSGSDSANLQLENENLKNKVIELQQQIDNCQMEHCKTKLEVDKLKSELETSKSQVLELEDQQLLSKSLQEEISNIHNNLTEEKALKHEAFQKIDDLQEELQALKSKLMECRGENEIFRNDLDESRRQFSLLNKQSDNLKTEIAVLKSQNETLISDNELLKNDSSQARGDFQTLMNEAKTLKIENAALRGEGDRLKADNLSMEIEIMDLKTRNSSHVAELDNLNSILSSSREKQMAMEITVEKLKDELVGLELLKEQLDKSQRTLSSAESQNFTLQLNLNAMKEEKMSLVVEIGTLRSEMETLRNEVVDKNIQAKDFEGTRAELSALKAELSECRDDRERLQRELEALKSQLKILKGQNQKTGSELQSMTLEVQTLRGAKEDLSSQIKELKATNDALEQLKNLEKDRGILNDELSVLKSPSGSFKASADELNALKSTLATLKRNLDHTNVAKDQIQQELDKAQNEVVKLNTELDNVKKKNRLLKNEVNAVKGNMGHTNKGLNQHSTASEDLAEVPEINRAMDKSQTNKRARVEDTKLTKDKRRQEYISSLRVASNDSNKTEEDYNKLISQSSDSQKISEELERLQKEFEQLQTENDKLKTHSAKLQNNLNELLTESKKIGNEHDEAKELDMRRESRRERLGAEMYIESTQPEDMNQYRRENQRLKADNDKLKTDLQKLNSSFENHGKDVASSAIQDFDKGKQDQSELDIEPKRLTKENKVLITSRRGTSGKSQRAQSLTEKLKNENDRLKRALERSEGAKSGRIKDTFTLGPGLKMIEAPEIAHELIRALDILRIKMEAQIEALARIRKSLSHMKKHSSPDSSKLFASDDPITFDSTNPIILEIVELSDGLTESILIAERELESLSKAWKDCSKENARLRKLAEDVGIADTLQSPKLPEDEVDDVFHPENWLRSLTLTQLADLHDKICLLTSNLVQQDGRLGTSTKPDEHLGPSGNQHHLQQSYNILNRRIAALQRQIAERQAEADRKVFEMHQTLNREQAELNEIKNEISKERKRNLMLHQKMDPCLINQCTAPCARKKIYF